MRARKSSAIAAAAVTALIFAGCGSSSSDETAGDRDDTTAATAGTTAAQGSTEATTPTTPSVPVQTRTGAVTGPNALTPTALAAVRALHTAARELPGGRPYDLEADDARDQRVWEIKVALEGGDPQELVVSANGRQVVERSDQERDDDTDLALEAEVTLAAALQSADRQAGGHLSQAEIDRDGGTLVWKATFDETARQLEHEVFVDATTGEVVRVETEQDDD